MQETPKQKSTNNLPEPPEPDPSTWEHDQKRHEYYYDDAHGYETFVPEDDEEPAEDTAPRSSDEG